MSFVSVVPFGDTLEHWWAELDGDPIRRRFIALKLLEVSAFIGNHFRNRSVVDRATSARFRREQAPNQVRSMPKVCVVIPALIRTTSDEARLYALLAALKVQSYPCHVLLVDDGSPPWRVPRDVHVITLASNAGPAAARNRGVGRALDLGAEVIAFTDVDCVPDPAWIAELVAAFQGERRSHAVSGTTASLDQSFFGRYHERNGTLNGRTLKGEARLLYGPSCNLAITAELASTMRFDETFPEAAAEDIEFCFRANQAGWTIVHSRRALVLHDFGYDNLNMFSRAVRFWKQFRRYARGERLLLEKHPEYLAAFSGSSELPVAGQVPS